MSAALQTGPWLPLQDYFQSSTPLEEAWMECLKYFVEFQGSKGTAKKKALLLSSCGIATLELAQGLIVPTTLQLTTFDGFIMALTNHFAPQPTRLALFPRNGQPRGLAGSLSFPPSLGKFSPTWTSSSSPEHGWAGKQWLLKLRSCFGELQDEPRSAE
ncbi:UNVERIFIED_CONTAM: hypothetical protein K2H54_047777 [Gekko kuhli]